MSEQHDIFKEKWAVAWAEKINTNTEYQRAAANWEGAIALRMSADADMGIGEDRVVVADLWHGECRQASAADEEAVEAAPYVIRGTPAAWKAILAGELDPLFGLMRGKIKLERGRLFSLLPYAVAAKELVESARQVPTRVPPAWE